MEEKQIRGRFQQKTDTPQNWEKAGNNGFVPKKGEIIVYQEGESSKIKIGDGITNVNQLTFSAGESSIGPIGPQGPQGPQGQPGADGVSITHSWNGTVLTVTSASGTSSADLAPDIKDYCKKKPQYTATPETFASVISSAEADATIQLVNGSYPLLELKGKNAYPENLTIVGGNGVNIAGISITSGVLDGELNNYADTDNAVLPSGLTLKNLMFISGSLSLRNCSVDDLRIESCKFKLGSKIIILPNTMNDEYGNDYTDPDSPKFTTRMNQQVLTMRNLVIRGCELEDVTSEKATAILVRGVENCAIESNWMKNIPYNGIQVSGEPTYGIYNRGLISISHNQIITTGDKSIRIADLDCADLYVVENTLSGCATKDQEVIKTSNCKNTTQIYSSTNRHEGKVLSIGNGITVVDCTVPHEERTDNPHNVTAEQIDAITETDLEEALSHFANRDELSDILSNYVDNDSLVNRLDEQMDYITQRVISALPIYNGEVVE